MPDTRFAGQHGHFEWSYGRSLTTTHEIEGELRERVLRAFGAPAHGTVLIEEELLYGGYSPHTQENSTSFRIMVQDTEHERSYDGSRHYGVGSVYAAFTQWLLYKESPAAFVLGLLDLASARMSTAEDGQRVLSYDGVGPLEGAVLSLSDDRASLAWEDPWAGDGWAVEHPRSRAVDVTTDDLAAVLAQQLC